MGPSHRINRGFHRLGIVLATLLLLAAGVLSVVATFDEARRTRGTHLKQMELICAQPQIKVFLETPYKMPLPPGVKVDPPPSGYPVTDTLIDLQKLGCSTEQRKVSFGAVLAAKADNYALSLTPLALFMGIALVCSLALYGLVRAVGWVISGFVAS